MLNTTPKECAIIVTTLMVGKKMQLNARIVKGSHTQKAYVNNVILEDNMKKLRIKRQKIYPLDLGDHFLAHFLPHLRNTKLENAIPI